MLHMGVERRLYLVRKVDPHIKREEVQKGVKNCVRYQSFGPAPNIHDPGEIGTSKNWTRLAIDITHCYGETMIDCGPGRLWTCRIGISSCRGIGKGDA